MTESIKRIISNFIKEFQTIDSFLRNSKESITERFKKRKEVVDKINKGQEIEIPKTMKPFAVKLLGISDKELIKNLVLLEYENEKPNHQRYHSLIREMSCTHLIALFDSVLIDILKEIFEKIPDSLKSKSKQLSYEEILKLKSEDEIKRYIIEREAHEFGYKSFKDQIKYLKTKFKFSLEIDDVIEEIVEIKEVRNLIIHNKLIVNSIYLNNVKKSQYKLNDKIQLNEEYLFEASMSILSFMATFEEEIDKKFRKNHEKK